MKVNGFMKRQIVHEMFDFLDRYNRGEIVSPHSFDLLFYSAVEDSLLRFGLGSARTSVSRWKAVALGLYGDEMTPARDLYFELTFMNGGNCLHLETLKTNEFTNLSCLSKIVVLRCMATCYRSSRSHKVLLGTSWSTHKVFVKFIEKIVEKVQSSEEGKDIGLEAWHMNADDGEADLAGTIAEHIKNFDFALALSEARYDEDALVQSVWERLLPKLNAIKGPNQSSPNPQNVDPNDGVLLCQSHPDVHVKFSKVPTDGTKEVGSDIFVSLYRSSAPNPPGKRTMYTQD